MGHSISRFRPGPHRSRARPVVAVIIGSQGRDFCMADSLLGSVWNIGLRNDCIVQNGSDKPIVWVIRMLKGREEDTFQNIILSHYLWESGPPSCSSVKRSIDFRKSMMMKSLSCTISALCRRNKLQGKKKAGGGGRGGETEYLLRCHVLGSEKPKFLFI